MPILDVVKESDNGKWVIFLSMTKGPKEHGKYLFPENKWITTLIKEFPPPQKLVGGVWEFLQSKNSVFLECFP